MLVEKVPHPNKNIVFVYTTVASAEEAREIGLAAINARLAICADYWMINSLYPWKGVIQDVAQYMLMISTQESLSEKLVTFIEGMHSYTTPMIAKLGSMEMNPDYIFWAENTLSGHEAYLSEQEAKERRESEESGGYHFGKLK